jgi:hypothetical protein
MTENDLDRLADYTAGALDPADAQEVDRLIATEPAWARAHAALESAQPRLTEALAGLPREPMPDEVAARLDRAITAASRPTGTGNVVLLASRRRRARLALGAAAAVAVLAAGLAGLTALNDRITSSSGSASRPDSAVAGKNPALVPHHGGVPTAVSGTDYTHDTLAGAGVPPIAPAFGGGQAQATADVPAALARLAAPDGLTGCLAAITAIEGGQATGADFARYQGQPALIVALTGGSARVVAVGADCGLAGRGAALLDSAP